MKAIGTDVSIECCRCEGYVVIYANANRKPINKDKPYRITQSNPEYWTDCGRVKFGAHRGQYLVNDNKSFNELLEILNEDYDAVANSCDYENCPINIDEPTIYDFLNLASDLVWYCGNHYFSN